MSLLLNLRSRRRLVLLYAGTITASAAILVCALPEQRWGVLTMGMMGLGLAWMFACIEIRRLRRRLHVLREAADALGGGQLIQDVCSLPNDDFMKLATSLNRLAGQVRGMAEEQDRLRQRLGRSEKLAVIGELAATVAHEVNNPLDGLQNSIRILRRRGGGSDPQTRQLLDMMESGLARIETTVRRLLSMSRDEPMHPMPTACEDIVDDAIMFVQPRLNRYGIRLVRDFAMEPVIVQADGVHMAQVLINLMINAADAMKGTGGELTVRCRHAESEPGKAWLDVIDTGCGIDPEHLPHIFEPFYSTKDKAAGTGLGLAVVARVVEAHRGRIDIETAPGQGTRFRIELPAASQAIESELLKATREESTVHGTRSSARVTAMPSESM